MFCISFLLENFELIYKDLQEFVFISVVRFTTKNKKNNITYTNGYIVGWYNINRFNLLTFFFLFSIVID